MEVTKVRFEAFKSLYDVTCDLDHFTVITGPNGAGKSNLVDALNFLGEVYADGLEFAVGRAGGYDNVAHRRTRRAKRHVAITVEATLHANDIARTLSRHLPPGDSEVLIPEDKYLLYRHSFGLGTANQSLLSDFDVRRDELNISDSSGALLVSVKRGVEGAVTVSVANKRLRETKWLGELLDPFNTSGFVRFLSDIKLGSTSLTSELLRYSSFFSAINGALAGTRVFQLSPYQCRTTGVPTPNAVLERHGENLPGAADHLRRNDRRAWARVQEAMRSILPDLQAIEIAYTEDRRLALQFREKGVGTPWNTGEMSDGTIQALALFIALFDSRNPLLVIEEPENSVHPWILRQFLDLCREVSTKQIIVTSHSPVLLNYVDPASVRLMSISNGRSQIRRLVDVSLKMRDLILSGEISVFDAYDSGVLPEALPRGFSHERALADKFQDS